MIIQVKHGKQTLRSMLFSIRERKNGQNTDKIRRHCVKVVNPHSLESDLIIKTNMEICLC